MKIFVPTSLEKSIIFRNLPANKIYKINRKKKDVFTRI